MGAAVSVVGEHEQPPAQANGLSLKKSLSLDNRLHGRAAVDPWAQFPPATVLEMVKAEEGFTICLEAIEEWGEKLDSAPDSGLRVLAEDAELDDRMLADMCATATRSAGGARIVTLSLPNNEIERAACLDMPNQIRSLNFSCNPLCGVPTLLGCTLMVDLDLSYCPELQLQQAETPPFLHLGSLLRLNLTSVGLRGLHSSQDQSSLLGGLEKLRELTLSENDLHDLTDAVAGLSRLKYLEVLEMLDNPLADEAGYKPDEFQAALPCLAVFDNKNLRHTWEPGSGGGGAAETSQSRRARLNMDADARAVIGDAPSVEQEAAAAMQGHHDNAVVA